MIVRVRARVRVRVRVRVRMRTAPCTADTCGSRCSVVTWSG